MEIRSPQFVCKQNHVAMGHGKRKQTLTNVTTFLDPRGCAEIIIDRFWKLHLENCELKIKV